MKLSLVILIIHEIYDGHSKQICKVRKESTEIENLIGFK